MAMHTASPAFLSMAPLKTETGNTGIPDFCTHHQHTMSAGTASMDMVLTSELNADDKERRKVLQRQALRHHPRCVDDSVGTFPH